MNARLLLLLLLWAGCSKQPGIPDIPTAGDPTLTSLISTSRTHVAQLPNSAEAWGKLGQAFHAAEFYPQARECYARATQLDPNAGRWFHLLGTLLLQENPEAAITNFQRAANLPPYPDASRHQLGRVLLERGRMNEGKEQLERVTHGAPNFASAQLDLARIYAARGSNDVAFNLLQDAKTNVYTARAALLLLGQIRHAQGDQEEAEDFSKQAAAAPHAEWPDPYGREVQGLRSDKQAVVDRVNRYLTLGRNEDAEHALWPLLKTAPGDSETLLLLGRIRYQQRECALAEEALRRHLALQPRSLNGLVQLSLALLCQQKWSEATEPLRKATEIKPDYAQAHFNLGFALSRQGETQAAIESLRAALRCNPGDAIIHEVLAEELRRSGATREADQHAQRASDLRATRHK